MRICILARSTDLISKHLRARLEAKGAEAKILEFGRLALGAPFGFDGEDWIFDGDLFSSFDAFFVRQIPAETAFLDQPGATSTAEEWWRRAQLAKERAHLVHGCLADLEARGKRVVNSMASAPFDEKPAQLAAFLRAGLRIPRTLITNVGDGVLAFEEAVGPLIFKPVGGGAETRLLDESAKARLDHLAGASVIFQERIVGPDVRVTIVGGRVVSAVEIPNDETDYRLSPTYRAGQQEYRAHALTDEAAELSLRAAEICHQRFSGVELKRASEGYVLIEANSSPVYLDIERKTGSPITDAIANLLLQG